MDADPRQPALHIKIARLILYSNKLYKLKLCLFKVNIFTCTSLFIIFADVFVVFVVQLLELRKLCFAKVVIK